MDSIRVAAEESVAHKQVFWAGHWSGWKWKAIMLWSRHCKHRLLVAVFRFGKQLLAISGLGQDWSDWLSDWVAERESEVSRQAWICSQRCVLLTRWQVREREQPRKSASLSLSHLQGSRARSKLVHPIGTISAQCFFPSLVYICSLLTLCTLHCRGSVAQLRPRRTRMWLSLSLARKAQIVLHNWSGTLQWNTPELTSSLCLTLPQRLRRMGWNQLRWNSFKQLSPIS